MDWSGRAVIEGRRGSIPNNLPPILQRLNIDPAAYVKFINRSEKSRFSNFIGPVEAMRNLAERFGKSFLKSSRLEILTVNIRETLLTLAEQLPEDASIEDVIERLRYLRAVEEGKRAAARGDFASDEEVRRVLAKYGVEG